MTLSHLLKRTCLGLLIASLLSQPLIAQDTLPLASSVSASASAVAKSLNQPTQPSITPETAQVSEAPKPVPLSDDGSRVTVLGYHDFTSDPKKKATAMRITQKKFRAQMQQIKDANLPVISMEDFVAWKRGQKALPPQSVLITIDDGWKSVYTDAFPVLKEFGYPFTVYIYKNYLNIGGRSMTSKMIEEMCEHKCTVGCHSVSHPFPSVVKKNKRKGPEHYNEFIRDQLGTSKTFLEKKFGEAVTTYAYPGGFYTEEMFPIADELGYDALFTCLPGKVRRDAPNHTLNRYIILGNNDVYFKQSMVFRANGSEALATANSNAAVVQKTEHPVSPRPGGLIQTRLPKITADLTSVEGIIPDSLVMRVTGFGQVPVTYNPITRQVSWHVPRAIRQPSTLVTLQWKTSDATQSKAPMTWTFQLDREAAYQAGAMN